MAKRRRRRYPEPGNWVDDTPKELPTIEEPDPLPDKVTVEIVRLHVEYEGLGHCIWDLIPADRITDKRLRRLWKLARLALKDVVEYLDQDSNRITLEEER